MTKVIHELLDIDSGEEEMTNLVVVQEETKELSLGGSVDGVVEKDEEDIRLDNDFDESINNIKDAITIAKAATDKVANIASDSEDDKDFNALTNLLKLQVEASERIVGLYSRKMEYKERKKKLIAPINATQPVPNGSGIHIEKAVFTGTLEQLGAIIDGETEK